MQAFLFFEAAIILEFALFHPDPPTENDSTFDGAGKSRKRLNKNTFSPAGVKKPEAFRFGQ